MSQAKKKAPSTEPWLAWSYDAATPLICQGKVVTYSKTGVHQGDTMAPAAFSLGLDKDLEACSAEEAELPWVSWYLDDGTIYGPLMALLHT